MTTAVIVDAIRTPLGRRNGKLKRIIYRANQSIGTPAGGAGDGQRRAGGSPSSSAMRWLACRAMKSRRRSTSTGGSTSWCRRAEIASSSAADANVRLLP